MLIAGGAIVAIGLVALALSGSSDGSGGASRSKTTSHTPSSSFSGSTPSSSHYSLGNPPEKGVSSYQQIKNEIVKATLLSVSKTIETNKFLNENNPGVDICNFNNGNAQCQSAAVLQSLIGINTEHEDNKNLHELVYELKAKKDDSVSINNFLSEFANKNLINERADNNPLHRQYELFMTGKSVDKNSNGHGVATTKTSPKTASATEYMNALMSLFKVKDEKYCIRCEQKAYLNGYLMKTMPAVITPTIEQSDRKKLGDEIKTLSDLINISFKQDKDFVNVIRLPNYLFLSTESMLPSEILYILASCEHNGSFAIFEENYRIKSMVCRKTSKNLLMSSNLEHINTSAGTHFVCIQNDYKNKKFIKIDSSQPKQIKSCPNDNVINFVKDESGSYNIPVIIIFEKEGVAEAGDWNGGNPVINNHVINNRKSNPTENNDASKKDWNTVTKKIKEEVINFFEVERRQKWPMEKNSYQYNQDILKVSKKALHDFEEEYDKLLVKIPNNLSAEDREKMLRTQAEKIIKDIMKNIGLW